MTSRVAVLEAHVASHGDQDARFDRGRPSTRRHGGRRERGSDDSDHKDNIPVPAEIKVKTVTHLLLTDPPR